MFKKLTKNEREQLKIDLIFAANMVAGFIFFLVMYCLAAWMDAEV